MVDWTKPIQTRDGRKAEVVYTAKNRLKTKLKYLVVITDKDGDEWSCWFPENGVYGSFGCTESLHKDIINVPEKRAAWINAYSQYGQDCFYLTKEEADEAAGLERLGGKAIRVEYEVVP